MELAFEENNTPSYIKEIVEDIIEHCPNGAMHKGIIVELLGDDELDNYEDDKDFIKNHKDTDDIYMVYQVVSGSWNQPLTLVAIVEY